MKSDNDNTDEETESVYFIDASKVFDGMRIACGEYLLIARTRDIELPDGSVIRIAGVQPVVNKKKEKPELIL